MLEHAFQTLGFSDKEQLVYRALVSSGKCSATALSKRVRIPRATLYAVLDSLVEKGVIAREPIRGSRLFVPNQLSALQRLVEKQKVELSEREQAVRHVIDLLGPHFRTSGTTPPKLLFFEGEKNIENMLYEYLPVWRESYSRVSDFTLWGYQDHTFVERYAQWHAYMWETRGPQEKIRLFSNSTDIEKELRRRVPRREVRPLPAGVQFSSSIWIYGEYIVMGVTRQTTHYAYQLRDPMFAGNLRSIFEHLWRVSPGEA